MLDFLFVTIGLLTLSNVEGERLSVRDLVDAHLSGNAIHSIDVDITMSLTLSKVTNRPFTGDGPPDRVHHLAWILTPGSERIQCIDDSKPDPQTGYPTNVNDFLRKPGGAKLLRNYDWNDPQTLTPVHQGTVYAEALPATTELPVKFMDTGCILLRRFEFLAGQQRRTLRELIAKDGSNAEVVSQPSSGLIALKVKQETKGDRPSQNYHLLYFDPAKDYAIRKLETHIVDDASLGTGPISFVRETTVEDYHDAVDGVFVPKTVIQTTGSRGALNSKARFDIKLNSVNQPVAKSRAEFDFPEYALVRTANPEKRRFDVQLWGKNGPLFVMKDRAQLRDYWGKDDPLIARSVWPGRLILIGVIALGVTLVLLWLYRRLGNRRDGVRTPSGS